LRVQVSLGGRSGRSAGALEGPNLTRSGHWEAFTGRRRPRQIGPAISYVNFEREQGGSKTMGNMQG